LENVVLGQRQHGLALRLALRHTHTICRRILDDDRERSGWFWPASLAFGEDLRPKPSMVRLGEVDVECGLAQRSDRRRLLLDARGSTSVRKT